MLMMLHVYCGSNKVKQGEWGWEGGKHELLVI